MYRLDFIIIRVSNPDGTYKDLAVDEFIQTPTNFIYNTLEEAECARIDLSRSAENGYYRIVEF